MNKTITISKELKDKAPGMALGTIWCKVQNSSYHTELWEEIQKVRQHIQQNYALDTIKEQPNIQETRKVYKACGKDPNRYRPSSESLYRRILKDQPLYQINTLVDLVNLLSLQTGYSIGGFDESYIQWPVEAGIGKQDELFEGIGRGSLNIAHLPVLRDQKGPIGTPTSDEKRTAIRAETQSFFMNINGYTGYEPLEHNLPYAVHILQKYAGAHPVHYTIIT